jgi:methyl halide transferase
MDRFSGGRHESSPICSGPGDGSPRRPAGGGPAVSGPAAMLSSAAHWDERYRMGYTPWQIAQPSSELMRVVIEDRIAPCVAIDLGCGTGTHTLWMAEHGFAVTGVDLSPLAIEIARRQAAAVGTSARFVAADLLDPPDLGGPYQFFFDRGCYHHVRTLDLDRYVQTLQHLTRPGSVGLVLTGNANEPPAGPPVLTRRQILGELGRLFEIVRLREFRFGSEVAGRRGWLGWSCLVRRT